MGLKRETAGGRSIGKMSILKRLIRSAIESFPIDPEKKDRLLGRILEKKKNGGRA